MISAGNEPFAGSSIGPEGWQCEISMSRLSGESSLFLTFHLDRSLCGEACVALFCSATGCAGPASAFNWADECEARLTCWCRSDTHQPGLELDFFSLGQAEFGATCRQPPSYYASDGHLLHIAIIRVCSQAVEVPAIFGTN